MIFFSFFCRPFPQVQGHGGEKWNKHGLLRAKARDEAGHGIEEAKRRAKGVQGHDDQASSWNFLKLLNGNEQI